MPMSTPNYQSFFKLAFAIVFSGALITGCSSVDMKDTPLSGKPSPYLLPQNVKKICINEILDDTRHRDIEPKFRIELRNEFIRTNKIEMVDSLDKSDAYLDLRIVRYLIEPLTYDSNFVVEEQKLWVLADIRLTETTAGKILWVEKRLSSDIIFNVLNPKANEPSTEIDAIGYIIKDLSNKIVKRTLEGWFAASGISDKK